jgi:hypothetical protein
MSAWDVVIDVSNVCWDPQLPPVGRRAPVWGRLELVMAAWRKAHGSDARITLVADNSLEGVLEDPRELRRLRASRGITSRPVADPEILALARDHNWHVLSRDRYIDQRRDHPWIPDVPERFHQWLFDGQDVTIVSADIRNHTEQEVSAAIEGKQLKWRHRLDPGNSRHRAALQTRWQCPNALCPESAHWQGELLVWPVMTDYGQARCPTCDEPLTDLGRRKRLHEIVVAERSGAEIIRFPMETGTPVLVGRGRTIKGVNLRPHGLTESAAEAVESVSRRHLALLVEEPPRGKRRVVVTDLGSKNGTVVERPPGTDKPAAAEAGKKMHVTENDLIVLGDAVTLRLSGKQYAATDSKSLSDVAPDDEAPQVTVVRAPS